jgi:predicted GIY-YIG superfamily endonuclease
MNHYIMWGRWYVYTIHFGEGLPHGRQEPTKHYTGITHAVDARMARHQAGQGARLMAVVRERGISWEVAEVRYCKNYQEAKALERRLKQHGARRRCPICLRLAQGSHPRFAPSTQPRARKPMVVH